MPSTKQNRNEPKKYNELKSTDKSTGLKNSKNNNKFVQLTSSVINNYVNEDDNNDDDEEEEDIVSYEANGNDSVNEDHESSSSGDDDVEKNNNRREYVQTLKAAGERTYNSGKKKISVTTKKRQKNTNKMLTMNGNANGCMDKDVRSPRRMDMGYSKSKVPAEFINMSMMIVANLRKILDDKYLTKLLLREQRNVRNFFIVKNKFDDYKTRNRKK
uniref:Uncharacterized protein n=1 Tax=Rhodnius prolixus TaxID=13249 RepID=T1HRX5_RHOPR